MIEFLVILALVYIFIAIMQDFHHREISNWLNFSLILFALVFRGFLSIFTKDISYLIFGLIGLAVFFILGHLLYYGRLFAGGDAKLFIALGTVIPIADSFYQNNLIFFVFFIALLFGGAIYSLAYSMILAFIHKNKFTKNFKKRFTLNLSYFYSVFVFSLLFIFYVFITGQTVFLAFPIFALGIFFIYLFAKSVEESCMFVLVPVSKLTVGDWLAQNIKVKNKVIKPYWEGLNQEQVNLLKKNYKKKVLIKQGIPFTPAFLIAILVIFYVQFFLNGDFGLYSFF